MPIAPNHILTKRPKSKICYDVKIIDLTSHLQVRKYSKTMMINNPDHESEKVLKNKKERCSSGGFTQRALVKSFNDMLWLSMANQDEWISFITLTFKENISDLNTAHYLFKNSIYSLRKSAKQIGIDLKYLGVPEFQNRNAVHYHLMTNIPVGSILIPRKQLKITKQYTGGKDENGQRKFRYINMVYYDLPWWSHGFSSAFGLNDVDDKFSVSGYLAKYFWQNTNVDGVGEGMDQRLFGRIKCLHSRNLKKPQITLIDLDNSQDKTLLAFTDLFNMKVKEKTMKSRSKYCPDVIVSEYQKL